MDLSPLEVQIGSQRKFGCQSRASGRWMFGCVKGKFWFRRELNARPVGKSEPEWLALTEKELKHLLEWMKDFVFSGNEWNGSILKRRIWSKKVDALLRYSGLVRWRTSVSECHLSCPRLWLVKPVVSPGSTAKVNYISISACWKKAILVWKVLSFFSLAH